MVGKNLTEVLLGMRAEKQRYYEDVWKYSRMIKDIAKSHDESARVFLFGSFVKGSMRPDSDVDVLIMTSEAAHLEGRIGLRVEIAREIGDVTPFQIHIVTPAEYEEWYRRFMDKYAEI